MNEQSTSVVTRDVDVTVSVGYETAGERWEMGENRRKALSEKKQKVRDGDWWAEEEVALLDVVAGEHREVGSGELEVRKGGFCCRKDS